MLAGLVASIIAGAGFFAALPSTNTYQLNSYGFGSGGTAGSTTSTYALEGITGELSGSPSSTTTYTTNPGYIQTQQANVPKVTFSSPTSSTLKFVIDQQGNPSDALFALQVKTGDCNFASGTINYVKTDDTLGATLTTADYQTYAAWGSATGTTVIGLSSGTTYCIRAKATQHTFSATGCTAGTGCGRYTESDYGPSSSATTSSGGQTISFCVYLTNASCGTGGSSIGFGALSVNTVVSSSPNIGVDFATNASSGGSVFIHDANGGIRSSSTSYTLTSATADLSAVAEGFGAQVASSSQTSGGPFSAVSPYNAASNNVGVLATTYNTILTSTASLVGGTASINLKVKPSTAAPAASDYSETLTLVAAAIF